MKKRIAILLLLIPALLLSVVLPAASVADAAASIWQPSEDTKIFWVSETSQAPGTALTKQIQLFDSELAAKVTTTVLPIVYGKTDAAGSSDILLHLDPSSGIPAEGFRISISGNQVTICAADADGLFYGCRDLIRQLILQNKVSPKEDAPDVAERGVSLDNGRKYYSVEWIKSFIREMSWSNMNTLVLHFSEEMGLGIESKRYPWLAGRDGTLCTQSEVPTDNTYLTQDEIAQIVAYADLYHVDIVPSFDSPGHMNYVVKKFNEKCAESNYEFTCGDQIYTAEAGTEIGNYFHYNGKTAIVQGSRNGNYSRGIDISNEIAVAFTRSLIEEYAQLFGDLGCTKFDIGGDELLGWGSAVVSTAKASRWQQLDHWKEYAIRRTGNSKAVAYDAFLLYMNDLYDLVTDLGYTSVRMWNDDALRSHDTGWTGVVQLNPDIDIWYWTEGTNPVQTYLDAGYEVYNIINHYTYYVVSNKYYSGSLYTNARPEKIYNQWNPYIFGSNPSGTGSNNDTSLYEPGVLGSAFAVWCDEPNTRTQSQVLQDLIPLIRANAAKAWDIRCNTAVSYNTYCENNNKLGNAPDNLPEAPVPNKTEVKLNLTEYEEALSAFQATDPSLYTEDSFAAYSAAVQTAKSLAESGNCTQQELDSAVAGILDAKIQLVSAQTKPPVATPVAILQPSDIRPLNGKRVIVTVLLDKQYSSVEIRNSQGNPVALTSFSEKTVPGTEYRKLTVQFSCAQSGRQTYQEYALDSANKPVDGCVSFSVIP